MEQILIIGGGFAGLSAAARLCRRGLGGSVTLADKRRTADFLPILPDCLGRDVDPGILSCDIEAVSRKLGIKFVGDEIISVDLSKNSAAGRAGQYAWEHLVIASGAQTNFFGNKSFEEGAFGLVGCADARKLTETLSRQNFDNFIVAGGGYTGIEAATNLKKRLDRLGGKTQVFIVEKAPRILNGLPEWMRAYTEDNLRRMGISVLGDSVVEKIEDGAVTLSGARSFEKALVVWAAGVSAPPFIRALEAEKTPQGRIKVDEYLRFKNNCYAIGDSGYFCRGNNCLRMAVQFSIAQGAIAGDNIFCAIKGKQPRPYRPIDLGYIIPMANNRSCGNVLGVDLRGFLPTLMHYIMCAYRIRGMGAKFGILRKLFCGVPRQSS